MTPLVSICVPAYNDGATIGQTLSSLVSQSYPETEIIVCDNCSTDDTGEVARSFQDRGVRYHRNDSNLGAFPNWNRCIELAKGEFIAIYHADDVYDREIVEKEAGFLVSHPEAAAVFAMDRWIGEGGEAIGESEFPPSLKGKELLRFPEVFTVLLSEGNSFLRCPTFMLRRSAIPKVGVFDPNLEPYRSARDVEYYLRIMMHFPIGILDEKLVSYRISRSQGTADSIHLRTWIGDHFPVMDLYLSKTEGYGKVQPKALKAYELSKKVDLLFRAANWILKGDSAEAGKLLAEARTGITRLIGSRWGSWSWTKVVCAGSLLMAMRSAGLEGSMKPALQKLMSQKSRYY